MYAVGRQLGSSQDDQLDVANAIVPIDGVLCASALPESVDTSAMVSSAGRRGVCVTSDKTTESTAGPLLLSDRTQLSYGADVIGRPILKGNTDATERVGRALRRLLSEACRR